MENTLLKNDSISNNISRGEMRHLIAEAVQDALMDPDLGLELQEWVKRRLREKPQKFVSFEEIKKKYQ